MERENEIIQAIIKEISDIDGSFEREIEVFHDDEYSSLTSLLVSGHIEFTNAFPGTYDLPPDKGDRDITLYIDDVASFENGEEINLNLDLNYIINEVKKSL